MNLSQIYKKSIKILQKANITNPDLDARVLISAAIEKDQTFIITNDTFALTNSQYSKINRYIKRRAKKEPVAYIVGYKEFYGLDFFVNKHVLIPRPETEWLVLEALELLKIKVPKVNKDYNIIDIGTGSGCIIISLLKDLTNQWSNETVEQFSFYATDISQDALNVAKKNAKRLLFEAKDQELLSSNVIPSLSRDPIKALAPASIKFIHSDLFYNRLLHKKFDLIIANLPYVPISGCHCEELATNLPVDRQGNQLLFDPRSRRSARDDISFEPKNAIFADDNGSAVIKKFLFEAKNYLSKNGTILLELDPRNIQEIKKCAKSLYPRAEILISNDLARHERYLIIHLN